MGHHHKTFSRDIPSFPIFFVTPSAGRRQKQTLI